MAAYGLVHNKWTQSIIHGLRRTIQFLIDVNLGSEPKMTDATNYVFLRKKDS